MKRVHVEVEFAIVPEWLLTADISAQAVRLYAVLARFANYRTKKAHPSHKQLAEMGRCSVATVRRAIEELEALGALETRPRTNELGQTSNEYVLRVSRPLLAGEQGGLFADEQGPLLAGEQRNESHSEREKTYIESPSDSLPQSPFDRFWKAYPLKVERAGARGKFAAAVRRGVDPEAIIAGARRYRDDPNREDGYTKHPTTWLNNGCWDDEPIKPRRGRRDPRPRDIAGEHLAEALGELKGGGDGEGSPGEGLGRATRGGVDAPAGEQVRALPR